MTARRFQLAALQLCSGNDLERNLATCRTLAAQAAAQGATVILLPECFAFLGSREGEKMAVAERLDPAAPGPILRMLVEIARQHGAWVLAGGMPERIDGDDRRTYNACPVIAPSGELVAVYRKLHLFDVDIPGGAVLRESDATAGGRDLVVVDTGLARIGMSICYDLRFPELYREMVVRRGAQVLVVPAAFTAHTGRAHWHTLLRARAIENQCWVVAAAQYGRHNERRESYGHSLIIDPWGVVVAEQETGDAALVASIDLDLVDETRRRMPCLEHQVLLR
jgi:predicted amidohydrolase